MKEIGIEQEIIDKAKELRGMGLSYSAIGKRLYISASTAAKYTEDVWSHRTPGRKGKKNWPEWEQWAYLHEKYGRKHDKRQRRSDRV